MQLITSLACSQRQASLILSIYIGLILNSANLVRNGLSDGWVEGVSAVLAGAALIAFCYGLMGFFSLFGKITYKILASFTLLVSALASYYMIFFNVVIGYGVVASTLTMDIDLHSESIGYKCVLWFLFAGLLPCLLLLFIRINRTFYEKRWHGAIPLLKGFIPGVCAFLVLSLGLILITKLVETQAIKNNQYTASIGGVVAHSYLPTNWLASLAIYAHQIGNEDKSAKELFDPGKHFTYQATPAMDDLYVVFVIGETTRWDHMSLFGYERETTPLLAQEKNLIAMPGTSCDTATKLSLRCMFVRENGTEDDSRRTLKERNVFSVLRKLGFTSELFAMQSEVWFYSTLDANTFEIREVVASTYAHTKRPIDDMLLVDQMERSINKYQNGKHMVILHTKGSHNLYSQRYTREFARYTPECMNIDDGCTKEELVNAFDNTVLYIDYMLKNVFDKLRDKNALVFYIPDHGESIDENSHFHATPKEMAPPEQFRVPFMVWASDKFIAKPQHQKLFSNLKMRKENNFKPNHEQIFDSMLGCIGFSSPDGGINPQNDWCGDNPRSMAFDNVIPTITKR